MPDSLRDLEAGRAKLFQQIQTLGDFRPGSISVVVRRCGKPTPSLRSTQRCRP